MLSESEQTTKYINEGYPLLVHLNDGFLSAFEIINQDLKNVKLTVLTDCFGEIYTLKSLENIAHSSIKTAFLNAGSDYIISVNWKIESQIESIFMNSFYKSIVDGIPVEFAFDKAQLEVKKVHQEPYYWGAFGLIGWE